MDTSRTDHKTDTDQTDHHIQPYKHEITISVGGEDDNGGIMSKYEPPVITPTPSPRSTQSNQTGEEIASNSTDDDHAILTKVNEKMEQSSSKKENGIDNPAFENDKTSQGRPLSSFGQVTANKVNDMKESQQNGKSSDKPLGKLITVIFLIFCWKVDDVFFFCVMLFYIFSYDGINFVCLFFPFTFPRSCEFRISEFE